MEIRDYVPLARTNHRGLGETFGILGADRLHHVYVIGKTGTGKSTLLRNIVLRDIVEGRGVGLIDPHGNLAEELLSYIPRQRLEGVGGNDVIYFDPSDVEYPIGFNLLDDVSPLRRDLVASAVVSAFKSIWSDAWGASTEDLLRNSVLTLMENPGSTLLGVPRLLKEPEFRKRMVWRVRNLEVRRFWEEEYARYDAGYREQKIAPLLNKVRTLLSTDILRNILGQPRSGFSIREVVDQGKIFIANLSKGKLGEDKTALLGSLLVAAFGNAALSRASEDRSLDSFRRFYLAVDEFHSFTTESFATILSEARKYGLALTLAHQFIDQLAPPVRSAVFGNVGTLICFRVGNTDAVPLAQEFAPEFEEEDLVNLPNHKMVLKLMIHGQASRAFSATSLPPLREERRRTAHTVAQTRRRLARPKAAVEERLRRWLRERST